ncbi:hypothetical protein QL285_030613 [Trifolium repens]|nr:hypothetical protein QL285_030613 [Trifolium repens]
METKVLSARSTFLSRFKDVYNVYQVDCTTTGGGRAGGLLLLWNSCNVDLTIINQDFNYIDMQINYNNIQWRATGLYGFSQNHQKHLTCSLINELAQNSLNHNWLLFGDFNIILSNNEKLGGNTMDSNIIDLFRNTISNHNMQDLGYSGEIYTWNNRQDNPGHIKERLDRFLAFAEWVQTFPSFQNNHLVRYKSDHCPILLDFSSNPVCRNNIQKPRTPKYELMWTSNADHHNTAKAAWQQARGSLKNKLAYTLAKMNHWGRQQFGSLPKKIKEAQAELQELNQNSTNSNMIQQIQNKELELDNLLESEEMWWSQRSRVQWLQHGDKNTKFFHQKATHRRKRNQIDCIQDNQGTTFTEEENIENILINHFRELFTSQETQNVNITVEVVKNRLNDAMKDYLNTSYTAEEVHQAILSMKSLAAPGPDGLPALFYHNYWDLIGNDVTEAVLQVLNQGGDPSQYNATNICLIPKINNPKAPGDYRPIALCNVIFKIITKTIANRIKTILPNIISQNQSAFIHDRLITDNTLVAFEVFHYLNHTNRKKGFVGIKTDMAKAYDRVEWNFLKATMDAMGFPPQLVNTIFKCVSTVQFSILINGSPSSPFSPQRGLRQGDPLSPYLFIICADVLSGLIAQAHQNRLLHGVKVANGAPEITHLLFADDSIFFYRANKKETSTLKDIILLYQSASGQMVNMNKSELIYSKKVPESTKGEIAQILPMKRVEIFSKYLGMPTNIGRSKQQVFNYLTDKVWKKLKGWKEKHLSFAGRGVLIKAVIQVIPTYIMSCFRLPKSFCKQLESMACRFWWGSNIDQKRIHWVKWKNICRNKHQGGLGFRDTNAFNDALLAKQGWRIATQPDSLVARVMKAKYFPNCHFMKATLPNSCSYTWRSIMQARRILQKGCFWSIGSGEEVNIWEDNWLPHQNGFKTWSRQQGGNNYTKVKDLIDPSTKLWDYTLINDLFLPFEAQQICQIPLVDTTSHDELTWPSTKDGNYSVKSGYHALINWDSNGSNQAGSTTQNSDPIWKHLWKQRIPPKQTNLLWRIFNHALPVKNKLNTKGINCSPICPRCNKSLETIDHVFMRCDWAKATWFCSPMTINFNNLDGNIPFTTWLSNTIIHSDKESIQNIAALIYNIWRARNLLVFQGKDIPAACVAQQAIANASEYQTAGKPHHALTTASNTRSRGNNTSWIPPTKGTLKLNVDAHPCDDGRLGLGLVLRTDGGKHVGAATSVVRGSSDALEGEARGLAAAIEFAYRFPGNYITIEMDSKIIVDAVNDRKYGRNYWGRLARRNGNVIHTNPQLSIAWTKRTGNLAAHVLANWALSEPNKTWADDPPLCIKDIIQKEISSCNSSSY